MSLIDAIGWVGVVGVLTGYWLSTRGRPEVFDKANVLLCVPVALPAIVRGAWPPVAISLAFGAIGLVSLVKRGRG